MGVYNNILCIIYQHSTITVLGKRFLATLAVYATSLNSISLRNNMLLPEELKLQGTKKLLDKNSCIC